ncbi:MAG: outer membrane beta-barrel protein [Deltaproteobacteria bacterium]|jgi:opacity protein-like surface antigen|nr:outer membrane beta-barrel protein [Deltaproteobacteria bacterium]
MPGRTCKKNLFSLAVLILTAVTASPALGAVDDFTGFYVAPKGLYSSITDADLLIVDSFSYNPAKNIDREAKARRAGAGGFGLAVGYDFYPNSDVPLRFEIEAMSRTNYSHKLQRSMPYIIGNITRTMEAEIGIYNAFFNVFLDLHTGYDFSLYIGAGAGLALTSADLSTSYRHAFGTTPTRKNSSWNTGFAWNAGLGCSIYLGDRLNLDIGARYADYGKTSAIVAGPDPVIPAVTLQSQYEAKFTAVEGVLSLRYSI